MPATVAQLRENVRFEQRALDAHGERLDDWVAGPTARARIYSLKGGEAVLQSRIQGVQPVVITVRAWSETRAVTNAWRIVDNRSGQIYDIKAVTPTEDRNWIDFLADANGGGGGG